MLEDLLTRQIQTDGEIGGRLAVFDGNPAFFYQKSPKDEDVGWEQSCFPRVEFTINRYEKNQKNVAGMLYLHVWVSSDCLSPNGGNLERELELLFIDKISGTFYTENGVSTCASWLRSMAYVGNSSYTNLENSPVETYGITLEFELMDFISLPTVDPDPVVAVNAWTKKIFPEVQLLGEESFPSVWSGSDERPIFYWRFVGYEGDLRQNYSVNWYTGQLVLHVFTSSVVERNRWIKGVSQCLQVEGEFCFEDGSPFFVKKIVAMFEADPLVEGQLKVLGQFGVLASLEKSGAEFVLANADFNCSGLEK